MEQSSDFLSDIAPGKSYWTRQPFGSADFSRFAHHFDFHGVDCTSHGRIIMPECVEQASIH
jgi:hypothetical protein